MTFTLTRIQRAWFTESGGQGMMCLSGFQQVTKPVQPEPSAFPVTAELHGICMITAAVFRPKVFRARWASSPTVMSWWLRLRPSTTVSTSAMTAAEPSRPSTIRLKATTAVYGALILRLRTIASICSLHITISAPQYLQVFTATRSLTAQRKKSTWARMS